MAQIIQICKFIFLITFLSAKPFEAFGYDFNRNEYGNYLSWEHAKNSKDLESLQKFFKHIAYKNLNDASLEELLFESVVFDDWNKANLISSIILKRDEKNFSANLFKFFNDFFNNKASDSYLEKIDTKYFDINFLQAINIWKNINGNQQISNDSDNCVPVVCLHLAVSLDLNGKTKKSQEFFKVIEDENFTSYRIKELLLINAINSKKAIAENILIELYKHDLNLKSHNLDYIKNHKYLLNPIENQKDGMAEVLYNISSWFFSKELYKYAAFFGKISLNLRPNFNAMKLLFSGSLEKLGYQDVGVKYIENTNPENLYYYKFLRIKLSIFDQQKKNDEFINGLRDFLDQHPNRIEMKVLIADKYRKLQNYAEAIKIYTEIIESDENMKNSNILYSRGISYERINQWDKAERDFKEALLLNPQDAYILNYLAYSWLDRNKNISEALDLLEKAIQIEPSDGYIIDSLGWAYFLVNDIDKSVYFLEKAVSLLPDDATLNDHLGDAYWKAGRRNEAFSQWKRVLLLDPNFKDKFRINRKLKEGLK